MGILIKHPLHLGQQVWRITRGLRRVARDSSGASVVTYTPDPAYWEAKTCRDYECSHYIQGWETFCDINSPIGGSQIDFIRKRSGRQFREFTEAHQNCLHQELMGAGWVHFVFSPGQNCFRSTDHQSGISGFASSGPHLKPIQRDPVFKNVIPGVTSTTMDYDEFQDTMNEIAIQKGQNSREV